jgi:hypothetical protein
LEIKDIHLKDNQVSIIYKGTRIKNCRIFESRIVGYVHILNEVHMEHNGKIEAIYVE